MYDTSKIAAARKAVELIQDGMTVGLGTGSTASKFIELLAKRCSKEPLHIACIASSIRSEELAISLGLYVRGIDAVESIDITVDGADEVDPKMRIIKGLGGALLREKIIASSSKECVIIVDPSKMVEHLGAASLPIEVIHFGHTFTAKKLSHMGYESALRKSGSEPYITDNGNVIYDITLPKKIIPEEEEDKIKSIPGVVETGFFLNIAKKIIVGFEDGTTKVQG